MKSQIICSNWCRNKKSALKTETQIMVIKDISFSFGRLHRFRYSFDLRLQDQEWGMIETLSCDYYRV